MLVRSTPLSKHCVRAIPSCTCWCSTCAQSPCKRPSTLQPTPHYLVPRTRTTRSPSRTTRTSRHPSAATPTLPSIASSPPRSHLSGAHSARRRSRWWPPTATSAR
eukprot:Mycagemm_TRINITY_DN10009_c0_g2::TRINITY_DN10009_c0_g2_i1::g.2039::m.2039 type:complete len:105 gc:universal TRINITY_DN10009_c0_g2_i1:717-403(-)